MSLVRTLFSAGLLALGTLAYAAPENIALQKKASSSGNETDYFVPARAVDGKVNRSAGNRDQSRWTSRVMPDAQIKNGIWCAPSETSAIWFQIDLGAKKDFQTIRLMWEEPKAVDYRLLVSDDVQNWREIWKSKAPCSGIEEQIVLDKPENGQFVKLEVSKFKKFGWGAVSLYEFELFKEKLPEPLAMFAQSLKPSDVKVKDNKLSFNLPEGVTAKIIASTHKPAVALDGTVSQPLSDLTVMITAELERDGEKALTATLPVLIPAAAKPMPGGNAKPVVIPSLQEWMGLQGQFTVRSGARIVIPKKDAAQGKPTLQERMNIFAQDYEAVTGKKIAVVLSESAVPHVSYGNKPELNDGDICVSLSEDKSLGKEGYTLSASPAVILISASDAQGAFWGTRTLLQVFKNNNNTFPAGYVRDYPLYPNRGMMFDIGRKPVSLNMIYDVMKTMSWYKMNDLQLHINDNFIWLHEYTQIPNDHNATPEQKKAASAEVLKAAPTAFRLESGIVGKDGTKLTASDLFYTKEQFGKLIDDSREYGVSIIPEIDIPGHAMSFVRVRPELMYHGIVHKSHDVERAALLDASHDVFDPATGKTYREETLAFIESVFDEYLTSKDGKPPVFRDAVIHIGTDEYYGDAEDYRAFADGMLKYVKKRGHTPRLWGSLTAKPGKTPVESEGVQMSIWSLGWGTPQPAINMGYDIINILDGHSYIVPSGTGSVGGYGDYLNLRNVYNPSWGPHVMGSQRVAPGHPKLLGAQWALWNDNSFRRTTGLIDYDLFDRIAQTSAVFSEKSWNTGADQSYDDFMKSREKTGFAPGTNPMHLVPSKGSAVLDMPFNGNLNDRSENGYNARPGANTAFAENALELKGGKSFVSGGFENLAPDYTVEFRVKRLKGGNDEQILFSSFTGSFKAVQKETGRVGITRDTFDYSFDYTLPENQWVTLKLAAKGRNLTLFADGKEIGSPKRHLFPENHKYSTFIFPLETIGSEKNAFCGLIQNLKISR